MSMGLNLLRSIQRQNISSTEREKLEILRQSMGTAQKKSRSLKAKRCGEESPGTIEHGSHEM